MFTLVDFFHQTLLFLDVLSLLEAGAEVDYLSVLQEAAHKFNVLVADNPDQLLLALSL